MNLKQNYTEFYYKVGNSVIVLLFCKFVPFSTAVNQILKTWLGMHFTFCNIKSNHGLLSSSSSSPLASSKSSLWSVDQHGEWLLLGRSGRLIFGNVNTSDPICCLYHLSFSPGLSKRKRVQDCNFERSWVIAGGCDAVRSLSKLLPLAQK